MHVALHRVPAEGIWFLRPVVLRRPHVQAGQGLGACREATPSAATYWQHALWRLIWFMKAIIAEASGYRQSRPGYQRTQ